MEKYVITISRQFASLGRSIAQQVSKEMQIEFYDRDIVESTAKRMGQPISVISQEEENANIKFFRRKYPLGMGVANMQDEIFNVQTEIIRDFADKESCIIVGRCAGSVLSDYPKVLNVFVYAPYKERLKNCTEVLGMQEKNAKRMIKEVDKARENYRLRYSDADNPYADYDLMLDSSKFGVEGSASVIIDVAKQYFGL